ncbi:Cell death protease, partial [Quaeritorhiza haematococci]
CNRLVRNYLTPDGSKPSYTILPELLENGQGPGAGLEVTIYVGDLDYICNWVGVEWAVGNLTWGGARGFERKLREWRLPDGYSYGKTQSERGLTYYRVYDATHEVPEDQRYAAYQIIRKVLGLPSTKPVDAASTSTDDEQDE